MSQEKILVAIDILSQAKDEVAELLKDSPMLSIRVENTMGLLIRGINHANGFVKVSNIGDYASTEKKQMSSFFGLDVQEIKDQEQPAVVEVTKDEKEIYMERIKTIYGGFLEREDKDIVESVPKIDVLGVAKLAGITVENPASQKITQVFVKSIKKAIEDKNQVESDRAKELDNLTKTENDNPNINKLEEPEIPQDNTKQEDQK